MSETYAFYASSSTFMTIMRLWTVHTANTADQNPDSSYFSHKLCNHLHGKILPDR